VPRGIIDTAFFTATTAAIGACESNAELQALATEAMNTLNGFQLTISAQLELLAPQLALLTAPTNPGAAVTWVENFITSYLTPQLKADATYVAKAAALAAQIITITAAIAAKAESLIAGSIITLPALPTVPFD
jgi:hypothetical protein